MEDTEAPGAIALGLRENGISTELESTILSIYHDPVEFWTFEISCVHWAESVDIRFQWKIAVHSYRYPCFLDLDIAGSWEYEIAHSYLRRIRPIPATVHNKVAIRPRSVEVMEECPLCVQVFADLRSSQPSWNCRCWWFIMSATAPSLALLFYTTLEELRRGALRLLMRGAAAGLIAWLFSLQVVVTISGI